MLDKVILSLNLLKAKQNYKLKTIISSSLIFKRQMKNAVCSFVLWTKLYKKNH